MHIKNWDPAKTLTFIRYLLVGGWNTVFGMAVYAGLYHMIGDSVHYLILLIPSNVLAITNAFACYKFFVFKTKGNVLREYFRCYVVYGGMMLVGAALMFVLVDGLHLPPVIANCACVVVTTVVSYFAHRDFSFNRGSSPSSAPVPATTPPADATRERMPSERKDIPAEPTMRPSESRKPLVLLCLLSLLALLAHLGFMRSIPLPFMDSVHIHELGRLFLARTVPYASLMVNPDGANATTFFYLGPVLQELMYQVFGFAGPRVFPMLGLLVAAFFCRAWLLKKGTSHWLATTLALMVLSCPVLTQSVRFVRIDTWALALFFATVFLMESATGQSRHAMRNLFFMAGALMSLSLFVWPTSFVFFFFYLANLWTLRTRHCLSGAETAYGFLSLATGGFVMGVLLILPLCTELDKGIYNLRLHFSHCIVGQDLDMASNVFLKIKGGGALPPQRTPTRSYLDDHCRHRCRKPAEASARGCRLDPVRHDRAGRMHGNRFIYLSVHLSSPFYFYARENRLSNHAKKTSENGHCASGQPAFLRVFDFFSCAFNNVMYL